MSEDEIISSLLENFSNISLLLKNAENLETRLRDRKSGNTILIEESKDFIDQLHELSTKIKKKIDKLYTKLQKESKDSNNSEENDTGLHPVDDLPDGIQSGSSENDTNQNQNTSTNEEDMNDDTPTSHQNTDSSTTLKDPLEEKNEEEANDSVGSKDKCAKEIDTNGETVDPDCDKSTSQDQNIDPPKSLIRLVDLSKLISPKHKKSVKFDTSVIILTSSDEESSNTPLKVNKDRELKSSLKKSSHIDESNQIKPDPIVIDDGGEDNSRNSRIMRRSKMKENVAEKFKKIFKRSSNKSYEIVSKKSKNESDSESDKDVEKKPGSDGDSDNEKSKNKNRCNTQKKNAGKSKSITIESKIIIQLPSIECDQLKEIYSNNPGVFEVKSSKQLDIQKSIKRASSIDINNENPENKKSKVTEDCSMETETTIDMDSKTDPNTNNSIGDELDNIDDDILKKTDENVPENGESDEKNGKNYNSKIRIRFGNLKEGEEPQISNSQTNIINDEDHVDTEISDKGNEVEEKDENKPEEAICEPSKEEEKKKENQGASEISSDSDNEFDTFSKKREKKRNELAKKSKKKMKKVIISDSDEKGSDEEKVSDKNKKDNSSSSDGEESNTENEKKSKKRIKTVIGSDTDDEGSDKEKVSDRDGTNSNSNSDEEEKSDTDNKKKRRRRIKKSNDSSSDSDDAKSTRKHIRKVLDKNSLSETTKQAEVEEKERKARIAEKQKKYNRIFEEKKDVVVENVHLDYDEKTKEPLLSVHKKIVKHLKPHQVSGIQFMFDACFESVERSRNAAGSGCILAHCMGLGKTLQVVALTHTLLTNSKKTGVEKVMVVCPINTVLNWKAEFKKWVPSSAQIEVHELATSKKNYEREYIVKEWHEDGGVLIIGYHMFRNLSNIANRKLSKKMRSSFEKGLLDPGPDVVICDEGHLLKNEKTNLSIAMNKIKTARRVVLTGTPLQNNLKEYWCMVQFVKPNLLGTYKEYMNRFVNPITNGQYTDSTHHDTVLMRKRSHVLHKLLDGIVQRRDYSVLEPYLPPKWEYVIFVKLSEMQTKIYKHYMEKYARRNDGSSRTSFLFTDFQQLQRICTHPRVLLDKTNEKKEKFFDEDSEGSLKDFIDDGDASKSSSASSNSGSEAQSEDDVENSDKPKNPKARVTRALAAQRRNDNEESEEEVEEVQKDWWQEYCDGEELDNIKNSGKLSLLFEILKECEEIGDKILVFSQSLYTLNCIEHFLSLIDEATHNGNQEKIGGYTGTWELGLDYFRLDGSSSCDNRAYWCDSFNNPDNIRARLFLISTKAGGLGINLVAANRVIIFDVSWNPSHDIQSIYRVYRFGQNKPCYVYRFVTYGAMEMKIYERQVTKQAISKRVIDEQQIDRHYNQNDLQELYKCDLDPVERPIPLVPKDVLLGEMLQKYDKIIYQYHLHQSLLENKQDECLNEDERKAAWDEFENEKVLRKTTPSYLNYSNNMSAQAINAALMNIVKRDNPTWSDNQIKGIIPALVRQLQIQIEENDMSMYQRVVQEIQIMNQAKLKESIYQQQMMKFYQQQLFLQKQQNSVLGNLNITPQHLQSLYGSPGHFMNGSQQRLNVPSTSSGMRVSSDVIELND